MKPHEGLLLGLSITKGLKQRFAVVFEMFVEMYFTLQQLTVEMTLIPQTLLQRISLQARVQRINDAVLHSWLPLFPNQYEYSTLSLHPHCTCHAFDCGVVLSTNICTTFRATSQFHWHPTLTDCKGMSILAVIPMT